MKRLSLAFLVVLVLVLAFTPLMSANAEVQLPAYIKFEAYALGLCAVVSIPPSSNIKNYAVLGSGSIALKGRAADVEWGEIEIEPVEYYGYIADPGKVKAKGYLAATWTDPDNARHTLLLYLFTDLGTWGWFSPDDDYFCMFTFSYVGFHGVGSTAQRICGTVHFVLALPPPYMPKIITVRLQLSELEDVWLLWVPEQYTWYGMGLTIPAAEIFITRVELLGSCP